MHRPLTDDTRTRLITERQRLIDLLPGYGVPTVVSTLGGVAIGTLVGLLAGRAIAPLLFRVSPHDPLIYSAVAATLIVVGILASVIPAARAARVDPAIALRAD